MVFCREQGWTQLDTPLINIIVHGNSDRLIATGRPWMAKSNNVKIRLNSTADTGFFYVAKKNPRTMTGKLEIKKYDPVARKHVLFKEGKIK